MRNTDILDVAQSFRLAIVNAKDNREFDHKDRMSRFPGGCCDDASDLFAYYLHTVYGIESKQENAVYRDDDPYNTTNHVWLLLDNGTIIDITADQFKFVTGCTDGVYVGEKNSFYSSLEDDRVYDNFDITQDLRLWSDYKIITKYLIK